jgi:hypothetical protein
MPMQRPGPGQERMLAFARCMRSHGVPSFPDPTFSASGAMRRAQAGVNLDSPAFDQAKAACGGPFK